MAGVVLPPVTVHVRTRRRDYPGRSRPGTLVVKERVHDNSRKAVRNFGDRAEMLIKARAPVRTGYMKSQVKQEEAPADRLTGFARDVFSVIVFVDGNLHTETGAFYAIYVEYGTRHMRAQPFFWPGIRQAQREFMLEMLGVFR